MSTNAPEALDEALIRAGRIDVRVEFKFADSDQICQIFASMHKPRPRSIENLSEADRETHKEKAKKELEEVTVLADKFVKLAPESQFSPAQLQGFFLLHKMSAQSAVDNVEKWICDEVQRQFEQEAQAQAAKTESKEKPKLPKKRATDTGKTNPITTPAMALPSTQGVVLSVLAQQSATQEPRQEACLPMQMTLTPCGDGDHFYTPPSTPITPCPPSEASVPAGSRSPSSVALADDSEATLLNESEDSEEESDDEEDEEDRALEFQDLLDRLMQGRASDY